MTIEDLGVTPVALSLLACLDAAVAELDTPPANTMLRPGLQTELLLSQVEDECCQGLAWVRLVQVYPSENFPQPDVVYTRCAPVQYAAQFELGVARCAPRPGAARIPTADEWNEVTAAVLGDAAAMRRAVCCWTEANPDRMFLVGLWQPIDTQGGCVGGTQLVTIAITACDCPED